MSVRVFEQGLSMSPSSVYVLVEWLRSHVNHEFAVGLLGRWRSLCSERTEHGDLSWDVKRLVWASGKWGRFQRNKFYPSHWTAGGRRTSWHMHFWTSEAQHAILKEEPGSPIVATSREPHLDRLIRLSHWCSGRRNPSSTCYGLRSTVERIQMSLFLLVAPGCGLLHKQPYNIGFHGLRSFAIRRAESALGL